MVLGGNAISRRWWNPIAAVFSDQTLGQEEEKVGKQVIRSRKVKLRFRKKERRARLKSWGWKEAAISGEKSLLLSRRTSFFQENRFSIVKFLTPSSFSDADRRCKINILQHHKKFAFWKVLGTTKDGGMSTLKSTEGPCERMSINVPHERQDRHDRRQTSNSYSLFLSWQPSSSVLTDSKSYTNISAASVNSICTEDAQRGTCEDRNHWNHWASCKIW